MQKLPVPPKEFAISDRKFTNIFEKKNDEIYNIFISMNRES